MGKLIRMTRRGRRLRSLDEFSVPEFVGRMARVERRQKLRWYASLGLAVAGIALFALALNAAVIDFSVVLGR